MIKDKSCRSRTNTDVERTFQESAWKFPKVTNKTDTESINSLLDNKLGHFTEEEFSIVLTKMTSRKAAGLDKIPPEVWKSKNLYDMHLRLCNAVFFLTKYNKKWTKRCMHHFPKKGGLGITKNYRSITLTAIVGKV